MWALPSSHTLPWPQGGGAVGARLQVGAALTSVREVKSGKPLFKSGSFLITFIITEAILVH